MVAGVAGADGVVGVVGLGVGVVGLGAGVVGLGAGAGVVTFPTQHFELPHEYGIVSPGLHRAEDLPLPVVTLPPNHY